MNNDLLKYLDIGYFIKFFLIFITLYYFNIIYWGLTDPKNYYSYFLDHYLNYINWIEMSIVYTANQLTHIAGLNSYVESPNLIKTLRGAGVIISFDCLGLGVSSFWIAFVIANSGTWQKKLFWCLRGVVLIWLINCSRIAILLISLEKSWPEVSYIDHHDIFNVVAYAIILILIYFHTKKKSDQTFSY